MSQILLCIWVFNRKTLLSKSVSIESNLVHIWTLFSARLSQLSEIKILYPILGSLFWSGGAIWLEALQAHVIDVDKRFWNKVYMPSEKFICPACNSRNQPVIAHISPIFPNMITELAMCPDCNADIPAHLAYRWNGIGIKKAREEWKEYKKLKM